MATAVTETKAAVAEDNTAGVFVVEHRYSSAFMTGAGLLHSIVHGVPTTTSVITIYDNTAASGTIIAKLTPVTGQGAVTFVLDVSFTIGLTVVVATAGSDVTVSYR